MNLFTCIFWWFWSQISEQLFLENCLAVTSKATNFTKKLFKMKQPIRATPQNKWSNSCNQNPWITPVKSSFFSTVVAMLLKISFFRNIFEWFWMQVLAAIFRKSMEYFQENFEYFQEHIFCWNTSSGCFCWNTSSGTSRTHPVAAFVLSLSENSLLKGKSSENIRRNAWHFNSRDS